MADSPASSDLSDPPSGESDAEEQLSTAVPSSRPSVDITHADPENLPPPSKRRKTGPSHLAIDDRVPSYQTAADEDDTLSLSSDNYSSAPGSPTHDEYALRDEAQTTCLWRDCHFGDAVNNDELVKHVQSTHCATGGPKKTKYVCEWGECQRKTSNHPSGYALKAHMRSHTKEKPYYCALPECDKAFTRSDALAKHMRTVHEPEPPRTTTSNDPTPPSKKSIKLKLTNGNSAASIASKSLPPPTPTDPATLAPTQDEDGNPVPPSLPQDNIQYIPAHHPITGQPGFMITYPPDIHFTAWESSIAADQLMRLLRRQLHWAKMEGEQLKRSCEEMETLRREEFTLKEVLMDGLMEGELVTGEREGLLRNVDDRVKAAMEEDAEAAKHMVWTGGEPLWRHHRPYQPQHHLIPQNYERQYDENTDPGDEEMLDADEADAASPPELAQTPPPPRQPSSRTPSPPPTGQSGGFDGDADPYDNYLAGRMAEYEERERLKELGGTPQKAQEAKEADAVGALVGMSGK